MPKQKTKRSAAKRFFLSKTGKVLHRKMNRSHQPRIMAHKRKRQLRGSGELQNNAQAATIRRLIPYK
ncbi:MAG: 50S ribosomal protein L35 [Eubacteriales bacterium]|nr:50S ribosomal protein L35 [Eubacteriales bacterium]MDD3882940.1 50S ribosomal protein L35 [Eubacteriales bacterium]MDD4513513.1 50S ribosomal protein L35 [Eubacteriales bacterium]